MRIPHERPRAIWPSKRKSQRRWEGGELMQTTPQIIAQQLGNAYRQCANKARTIRQAQHILEREGVEVDWSQVETAAEPHAQAADHFRRELEKAGYVEQRFSEFIPKEHAKAKT